MRITNKFNLPEPVYLALTEDNYSKGDSNRSVTQLIDAPQARILRHEHDDDIEEDVSERIWIALGKGIHAMFEKYAKGKFLPEERLFMEVDGWVVSGQIDIQYLIGCSHTVDLFDYKSTSVYSIIYGADGEDEHWACQLNCYARLVEVCKNVKINALWTVVILRDWKMREAMKGGNYPQAPIQLVRIPLWDANKRAQYLEDRVRIHQEAEFERMTGGILPHCTDEDRWRKPEQFAVKKGKNKRAEKGGLFSEYEKAEEYIKQNQKTPVTKANTLWIERRKSEPTRCALGYCKAAPFCPQYQAELAEEAKNQGELDYGDNDQD